MPQYLSPGVYVEEVPPIARPIAGVGTSTAGFIGIVPDKIPVPDVAVVNEDIGQGNGILVEFELDNYPVQTTRGTFEIRVNGLSVAANLSNDETNRRSKATLQSATPSNAAITGDYIVRNYTLPMAAREVKLCTSFSEFTTFFCGF